MDPGRSDKISKQAIESDKISNYKFSNPQCLQVFYFVVE